MDRDTVIALANKTGLFDYFDLEGDSVGQLILHNFAALVAAHEREACAKVCDEQADKDKWEGYYANQCAAAIRSRT